MRRLAIALLFEFFLQFPALGASQNTPPPAKATIEGTVVRIGTGEPIPRASVTLIKVAAVATALPQQPAQPPPPQPAIIPAGTTDETRKSQNRGVNLRR